MMGGRGGLVCVDIGVAPSIPKKLNSTPKEQSGTIEKRSWKTKGKRQDDHTEVC
jgi:hypothetical protein